jgi:tRNA (cmo5U34)-methyltransferase
VTVQPESIAAFDLPERVAAYDGHMALMHPNRARMIEVALELLPFPPEAPVTALDLGAGTGVFTHAFLKRYARAHVIALDGAAAMLEMARARLGAAAERVEFLTGDFRDLAALAGARTGSLVFSSFALHHLNREEKVRVVRDALAFLEPGGWFFNADLVVAEDPAVEARLQELRVAGILRRNAGRDPRFTSAEAIRRFLDELEASHRDQPQSLAEDLGVLKAAGLARPAVFWSEYREAVIGGVKA